MIQATIEMSIAPDKQHDALEVLGSISERILVQGGCISCCVYRSVKEERVIIFKEIWRNQEDLDNHFQSEEYRKVLLVIEMASEEPKISFDVITSTTGVEMVEKARSKKKY